jgi:hypothetical protein
VRSPCRILLAAGLLAACGSADRVGETEDAVAAVLAERLDHEIDAVEVTCPDDADLADGASLECEVAVDGEGPQALALEIGAEGNARLISAVIPTSAAEAYLVDELAGPAQSDVEVDCGDAPLLIGAVGDTFTCEAVRASDGAAFDVTVELTAVDGTVRYRVETTTTTSA